MAIRKILVPMNAGPPSRVALMTAVMLARRLDAHVDALHVRIDPVESIPLIGEGVSAAMLEELLEISKGEIESRATKARAIFNSIVAETRLPVADAPGTGGVTLAWREEVGNHEDVIVRYGRLVDLLVLPRPGAEADVSEVSFEAALFESGRPVLIAPQEPPATIGDKVVIAWNGSAEAARAVAFALPILRRAEQVMVVTVVGGKTDDDLPKELVGYLAWHGITARPRTIVGIASAEDALGQMAEDADLLVMGAYTTSRLRELILGGVTRHMLDTATVPLLLAH